jgi:hypothetical protein
MTQAVGVGRFGHRCFAACADGIAPLPVAGLLVSPDLRPDLLLRLWQQEDVASFVIDVASALQAVVAFPYVLRGKRTDGWGCPSPGVGFQGGLVMSPIGQVRVRLSRSMGSPLL